MPTSKKRLPSILTGLQGSPIAGLLGDISPYDALMSQRRATQGPVPGMPLTQEEIAASELASLLFGTPGQNGPSALDSMPMQAGAAPLAGQVIAQSPADISMRRASPSVQEPAGFSTSIPPEAAAALRQARLANADRVLSRQPGAARHAAEIAERRRLAQMAAESGGTITEAQLGEATTPASMALLSRVPISNQAAYTKRRKPPSQFRGGLSPAIAGLGAPMGYEAEAEPEPRTMIIRSGVSPGDPNSVSYRAGMAEPGTENTLASRLQRDAGSPPDPMRFRQPGSSGIVDQQRYDEVRQRRADREDQIRANIQLRAAGGGVDPYAGLEMSPAEFRLLSRRNPALYVQARGQQADRFARSEAEQALADYRNDQTVLAREGLRDRRQQFAEEQRRLREQAELQFGGQMNDVDRELLRADLADLLAQRNAGRITDREYRRRRSEIEGRMRGGSSTTQGTEDVPEDVSYSDAAAAMIAAATHPGVQRLLGGDIANMSKADIGQKLWDAVVSENPSQVPDDETLAELRSLITGMNSDEAWANPPPKSVFFGKSQVGKAQLEMIDALLGVRNPSATYLGGFRRFKEREWDRKRKEQESRIGEGYMLPYGGGYAF